MIPWPCCRKDSLAGGEKGGQFNVMKLAPNFEMTMYLAQATGLLHRHRQRPSLAGDKESRGNAVSRPCAPRAQHQSAEFAFPQNSEDVGAFAFGKTAYPELFRDIFKYLARLSERGPKPNREAQLIGRFGKVHAAAQAAIKKSRVPAKEARISCVFPSRGIQDNTVNRLLLMSSSEKHLPSVPMAFFIEERMATSET